MPEPYYLTRTDLERELTPEQVRPIVIIRIALMAGVMFFILIITALYVSRGSAVSPEKIDLVNTLSIANAFFFIIEFPLSYLLSGRVLSRGNFEKTGKHQNSDEAARTAITLYRISSLISMALLEGASFFSIIVCATAIMNGIMDLNSLYWLNALPVIVFVIIGSITFPTRDRILETIERRLLQN